MRTARLFVPLILLTLPLSVSVAQDAADLTNAEVEVTTAINAFGQPVISAEGVLTNESDAGYTDVFLTVRAYDAEGAQIAEGYGVLVDACGAGVLPDYVMPPGHSQQFAAPLEFFEAVDDPASLIDSLEVEAQAAPADAPPAAELAEGITRLSDQEVIKVEWLESGGLRYAIGCPRDLFTEWRWRQLSAAGRDRAIEPPNAERVTGDLRERLGLSDPALFANSRLSFAPSGDRLIYQDSVNRFYTAAADGTLQRRLYTGLNSYVLQTIEWVDDDRFLAAYYGAVGDEVLWFTADAEARAISPAPTVNRRSVTAPGVTRDARRVVVGGTFDTEAGEGVTGYYLNVVTNGFFELLLEAELPGNNYPPPAPVVNVAEDLVARVYFARPVNGRPTLQCFNRAQQTMVNLAPLPLALTESDRAGLWLSPDETTLALAANGAGGGLWLIDLAALPACTG